MKITGKTRIFKNDKGYSTTISIKKEDGTYDNMYISVNFKKGIEVENNTEIDITDGFLSFFKTREGLPKVKIVVMEFSQEVKENNQEEDLNLPF